MSVIALRWVCGATCVMAAALGIGRFAYTPLLPEMVQVYAWDFGQAGDVASANFLGYLVGALAAPSLAGSQQIRYWIGLSLMASVATTALGQVAYDYVTWLVLRFAAGVASAYCLVLVTTQLLQRLDREDAAHLGNVHFAGVGIGILICMTVLIFPPSIVDAWRYLGGASALLMLAAWLALSTSIVPNQAATQAPSSSRTGNGLWLIITGYGFFGFGYVVSATFVVAMAQQISGSITQGTEVWWVVGGSIVPSVYAWQVLANRCGLFRTLRWAYLVEAVGATMAAFATDIVVLSFACVLLGGTFAAVTALGISAAKQLAGPRIAYAVSAMTVAFAIGQLIGPAVSGRIADLMGDFFWPCVLAGALLAISAALVRDPERVEEVGERGGRGHTH
ncbi:MAG: YbfB/YjiJ family MFS transporter [Pseudomonadota bacterium]